MSGWMVMPGVPAAGHVTTGGWWHPGPVEGCGKCEQRPTRSPGWSRGRAFCERCGYEPQNRSQAIHHAGTCGSIVRER